MLRWKCSYRLVLPLSSRDLNVDTNLAGSTEISVGCVVHRNFRGGGNSAPPAGTSSLNPRDLILFLLPAIFFGLLDMSAHLCFLAYLFIFLQVVPLVAVTSVRLLALLALTLLRSSLILIRRPWPHAVHRLMNRERRRNPCISLLAI